MSSYYFTSESVSEGHPDKVCDRISDAIVDAFLGADPGSRVAVETLTTTNRVVLAGETRGPASVDKDRMIDISHRILKSMADARHSGAAAAISAPSTITVQDR